MRHRIRVTIGVIASAALAFSLTACGGGASPAPTRVAPPSTPGVPPSDATVISDIHDQPGWSNCSATIGNNSPCAAGKGQAVAWMAQNQATPSVSGASAEFHLGGPVGYSNNLWWKDLGPNSSPTHFNYDFWLLTPDPSLPQALEFDVNQSFGGTRWVFGTECNLDGNGLWDVWDSSGTTGQWVPTHLGCPRLEPNTWAHFVWHFERVGNQVHYISLTVNDTDYSVDMYQAAQQNWNIDGLNVAIQLDGDATQQPYSVFIDKLTLTYW